MTEENGITRRLHAIVALVSVLAFVTVAACTQSVGEYNAILRGDRAFAEGQMEEALAEYRLAVLQGSEDPEVYGRVGHTYALMGRVDEAADHYAVAAAEDSVWADQAAADLVRLARAASARNDLFGVASAMQRALEFRPGLSVNELALPLARHYARIGEFGRAVPFFQRAMGAAAADSVPAVMYETALAYAEVGDCGRAVVFFEQFRETMPRAQRTDVNWQLGNCSYEYARQLFEEGRMEAALQHLDTTLELGEPRSVIAPAYFEKAEILSLMGSCREAMDAYAQAAAADVSGAGPLVPRARARIDQIRFGGYLSGDNPDWCGLPEPELDMDEMEADSIPADTTRGLRSSRTLEL